MRVGRTSDLQAGQKLARAVRGRRGQVLLSAGVTLTSQFIERLQTLGLSAVYVEDAETSDIDPPEPLSQAYRQGVEAEMSEAFDAVGRLATDNRRSAGRGSQDSFGASVNSSKELVAQAARTLGIVAKRGEDLVDKLAKQEVLTGLNSLKSHDNYTFQHSIDVAVVGIVLARKAGWDRQRVQAFGVGCLLHDVGKVFIDSAILNKPGPLNPDEIETLKAHPLLGYQLIKTTASTLGVLVPQVAFQHHERQDGTGYPRGLTGLNRLGRGNGPVTTGWIGGKSRGKDAPRSSPATAPIHDFGALSAVADVYDALTSDRPYRDGYHPYRALDAIGSMSGTHLNREAVELLCRVVSPFPVCSEVRVVNGRHAGWTGIVAAVSATEMSRPLVRLLADEEGHRISPQEIDLSVDRDVQIEAVGRAVRPTANDDVAVGALGYFATGASQNAGRPLPPAVREFLEQFDLDAMEPAA